jgi:hypothetical protein
LAGCGGAFGLQSGYERDDLLDFALSEDQGLVVGSTP